SGYREPEEYASERRLIDTRDGCIDQERSSCCEYLCKPHALVGGGGPEEQLRPDQPGDRDIGACRLLRGHHPYLGTGGHGQRLCAVDDDTVDSDLPDRPRGGEQQIPVRPQRDRSSDTLDQRCGLGVADEDVRYAGRHLVCCSAARHPRTFGPPAAEILDGGLPASLVDGDLDGL